MKRLLARAELAQSNVVRLLQGQLYAGGDFRLRSDAGARRGRDSAIVAAGCHRPIARDACNWRAFSACPRTLCRELNLILARWKNCRWI